MEQPMDERKKVMIVDDEITVQQMFTTILKSVQYDVVTASNGVECLEIVERENPDLILLDVHMPELDGYETISRLRQIKQFNHTPMVFLTGVRTTPKNIESGFLLGGTEYWTKPISAEEFLVRVRSVLRTADAEKKYRKLQQAFYSMIVHDLRGPLGAVLGFVELLMEEKETMTPDHVAMIKEIGNAGNYLLQIVKDLLELSQFESGEYHLMYQPVEIKRIFEQTLERFELLRSQKNITVVVDAVDVPSIDVDPDRIEEVFENLLDNALRFTPPDGRVDVSIGKRVMVHPLHTVPALEIIVRDNGHGMAESELPSIFDKNRITQPGARKASMRTGLGLPLCREIVEAHGGTISVVSESGKGTAFTILLPMKESNK
jgi:two-component system sensor histidine kinase/response regulator